MHQNNNFKNAQKILLENLLSLQKELLNLNKLINGCYPNEIKTSSAGQTIIAKFRNMQSNS